MNPKQGETEALEWVLSRRLECGNLLGGSLKKNHTRLPYEPAAPHLGIYPDKFNAEVGTGLVHPCARQHHLHPLNGKAA